MEITSWVEQNKSFDWKNSINRLFNKISYKTREKHDFYKPISCGWTQMGQVSSNERVFSFNLKTFFVHLGLALDFVQEKIVEYSKWILLFLASVFIVVFGSMKISSYILEKENFADCLLLPSESEETIESLYQRVVNLALSENPEYNSDGSLIGMDNIDGNIFIGQPVSYQTYKVLEGDTISGITKKFGLRNISTLIAVNDISNVRQLCAGKKISIPSMDGILYTIQNGNSLAGISAKFGVTLEDLVDVNELESGNLYAGQKLFIPGAKMDADSLREALGERFKLPIYGKYKISSYFGPRMDPIKRVPSNHSGVDFACPTGTPIHCVGNGTVQYVGESRVFGLYAIVSHSGGYQTLYAHMSKITCKKGQQLAQGATVGLVGSSGYSTGPHLHLSVYKNGKLINPFSLIKTKK